MSVVSSRVSSVSSILKGSGVRAQFVKQPNKVYFKLPKDIKSILCNFAKNDGIKEYEKLIHSLQEGVIKVTIGEERKENLQTSLLQCFET